MKELTSRVERSMHYHGIAKIRPSTKKHVCHKLETEIGKSLWFVSNKKGKFFVYPDSLLLDELVKQTHRLKNDLLEALAANSGSLGKGSNKAEESDKESGCKQTMAT